jgi:hypothetical protein
MLEYLRSFRPKKLGPTVKRVGPPRPKRGHPTSQNHNPHAVWRGACRGGTTLIEPPLFSSSLDFRKPLLRYRRLWVAFLGDDRDEFHLATLRAPWSLFRRALSFRNASG